MRIAIGCDHRGLKLKQFIIKLLTEDKHNYEDFGSYTTDPVDYPDIARSVAQAVTTGNFERGILICGTGIGMSIAANKVKGIRAALCYNELTARYSREHNDANILILGGRVIGSGLAREIVKVWLDTKFSQEKRHINRLNKIKQEEDKTFK